MADAPMPPCGAEIRTAYGVLVGHCNLRKGHLARCAEVCWELSGG